MFRCHFRTLSGLLYEHRLGHKSETAQFHHQWARGDDPPRDGVSEPADAPGTHPASAGSVEDGMTLRLVLADIT